MTETMERLTIANRALTELYVTSLEGMGMDIFTGGVEVSERRLAQIGMLGQIVALNDQILRLGEYRQLTITSNEETQSALRSIADALVSIRFK